MKSISLVIAVLFVATIQQSNANKLIKKRSSYSSSLNYCDPNTAIVQSECNSYKICQNNYLVTIPCPYGQVFDASIGRCNYPDYVQGPCGIVKECIGIDLTAVPGNCHKFYRCSSAGISIMDCPANLVFDNILKVCNYGSCSSDYAPILPAVAPIQPLPYPITPTTNYDYSSNSAQHSQQHIIAPAAGSSYDYGAGAAQQQQIVPATTNNVHF